MLKDRISMLAAAVAGAAAVAAFALPLKLNILVGIAVAVAVGLVLEAATIWLPPLRPIFRTVPLDGEALAWVAGMSLAPVAIGELFKVMFFRR